MALISKLSRLIGGVQRQVDLSTNTLVVGSIQVGATELTQTILGRLISLQNGSDVDATYHTHDGRYFTESELQSTTAPDSGATKVGVSGTPSNYTPASSFVQGHLEGIDAALAAASGSSFSDVDFDIHDNSDPTKIMKFEVAAISAATTRTVAMPDEDVDLGLISTAIQSSEKGANNGVATLDAGGKIPVSQLPSAVMTYEGTWDASTNTPTLEDGTGDAGMVYLTTVAGTVDFGSGPITFAVGDWAVYNGSIWQKSTNSNAVVSVNGQTGVVSLDSDDIDEGSTNLYFTDGRARTAVITQTITDDDTTHAPSGDAVFEALALKQDASANLDEADTFFGATDFDAAEAEQLTDGSNSDGLHSHARLAEVKVAGEAFAAGLWAVRYAKAADAGFVAGTMYKPTNDASSVDNFYVIGLTNSGGVAAAGDLEVVKAGPITVSGHGFTVGAPLFLGAAGVVTATAPTADNTAVVRVGMVIDANTIEVQIQVMGIN